jgi:hypothetical protein
VQCEEVSGAARGGGGGGGPPKPTHGKKIRGGQRMHALVKHDVGVLHVRLDTRASESKTRKEQSA